MEIILETFKINFMTPEEALQRIKDEVAKEHGYESFQQILYKRYFRGEELEKIIDEMFERYAKYAMEWRTFDTPPEPGQEIFIVWPSGNYHPEYRKLTEEDLKCDWTGIRWIPVPNYKSTETEL